MKPLVNLRVFVVVCSRRVAMFLFCYIFIIECSNSIVLCFSICLSLFRTDCTYALKQATVIHIQMFKTNKGCH